MDRCEVKYSENVKNVQKKWKKNEKMEKSGKLSEIFMLLKRLLEGKLKSAKTLVYTVWLECPENGSMNFSVMTLAKNSEMCFSSIFG